MMEEITEYKVLIELNDELEFLLNTSHNSIFNSLSSPDCDKESRYEKISSRFSDFYSRFTFLINRNKAIRLAFEPVSIYKLHQSDEYYIPNQSYTQDELAEFTNNLIAVGHSMQNILQKLILHHRLNNKSISLVLNHLKEIKSICSGHHIKTLYVFGSILNENFNLNSDIDFLYEIDIDNFDQWDTGKYDYIDNLLSFEQELKTLLKRDVDLVPDIVIQNKYLKQEIDKSKIQIYAA